MYKFYKILRVDQFSNERLLLQYTVYRPYKNVLVPEENINSRIVLYGINFTIVSRFWD